MQSYNLVTGAGGTIGSELCRQLDNVMALGRGENSLYNLDVPCKKVLANIKDVDRLEHIFSTHYIDAVYHAAAHKHVSFCEDNPFEAVQNNIIGTQNLIQMCKRFAVQRFVLVSTDKAVNPVNVMGHTKRLAEYITLDAGFTVVRLGNIFGSRGSVIPHWAKQIANGGPLTLTDPQMRRYFITAENAVLAIRQAKGNHIFVPDMIEFSLLDIAAKMIGDRDIEIQFYGRQPGEKYSEDLFYEDEEPVLEEGLWRI